MTDTDTYQYVQCGLNIRSQVPLALPVTKEADWDVDVRWGTERDQSESSAAKGPLIASYGEGETAWYVLEETTDGYRARFRECGEFSISADCSEVVVHPYKAERQALLPILMAGTVSAMLLSLRGSTVLHASAASKGDRAVAFVGQSGRGKSTLAALMCVQGAVLVTDDLLVVEPGDPPMCIGGAAEVRLRSKASSIAEEHPGAAVRETEDERLAFAPASTTSTRSELAGVVIPSPSETATEVSAERLSPSDALMTILSFPRVDGWLRPDVLSRDFSTVGKLVNEVPVWDVAIPWGPPFRPDIAATIAQLVGWEAADPDPAAR